MALGRGIAIMAAGAVGATAITGCAAGRTAPSAPPVRGAPAATATAVPTPTPSTVAQTRLPILDYELTATQAAEVQYLSQRAIQTCMRGFGIDYLPGLSTASIARSARAAQEFDSRWYGVSDLTAVRTDGYHLPAWAHNTAGLALLSKLPTVERKVLEGTAKSYAGRPVPDGGCLGRSAEQLAASGVGTASRKPAGADSGALVAEVQAEAFQHAQADPRVLSVFAAWSVCMRTYGYHYDSPFNAAADPRWRSAAPGTAEVTAAEHDISCKARVNLLGVEFAVVSDYQNVGIAKNSAAMAAARAEVSRETAGLDGPLRESLGH